jgi:hypothetical protein
MKRKKLQLKEGDLVLIKYDKTDLSFGYAERNPFGIFTFVNTESSDGTLIRVKGPKIPGFCHFYTSQIVTILDKKEKRK